MENTQLKQKYLFLVAPILGFSKQGKKTLMDGLNPYFDMIQKLNIKNGKIPSNKIQVVSDINGNYHALFYAQNIKCAENIADQYDVIIPKDGFHKTNLKNLPNILGFN